MLISYRTLFIYVLYIYIYVFFCLIKLFLIKGFIYFILNNIIYKYVYNKKTESTVFLSDYISNINLKCFLFKFLLQKYMNINKYICIYDY